MTTIKISVRNKQDANLLYRMLKRISFVDNVEKAESNENEINTGQFSELSKLLAGMAGQDLFRNISDPITWQQNLRNEWE